MKPNKKIEFIIQLRNSALTMWGYLISVSLGISVYLGASNIKLSLPVGIIIIILYILFSASNAHALFTNFKSRIIISKIQDEKEDKNISALLSLNTFSDKGIAINMSFHALIDICVILMVTMKIKIVSDNICKVICG